MSSFPPNPLNEADRKEEVKNQIEAESFWRYLGSGNDDVVVAADADDGDDDNDDVNEYNSNSKCGP